MDILATDLDRKFCRRLSMDIRKVYPKTTSLTEDIIFNIICDGVKRARSYGLTWESSIADFVGLIFDVGADFDPHPTIRKILIDEQIAPNLRVKELVTRISGKEWREIRKAFSIKDTSK